MAKKSKRRQRPDKHKLETSLAARRPQDPDEGDRPPIERALHEVRTKPLMYFGGLLFIAAAFAAGLLYNMNQAASARVEASAYARAVFEEEPEAQLAALKEAAEGAGTFKAEMLYVAAETAYEIGEYDEARRLFQQVRDDFPDSPFAADAIEGLGYIAENEGDFDQAIEYYRAAEAKSDTFAAKRQAFNIGRTLEAQGDFAGALEAYRRQADVFPGSRIAARAQQSIEALRAAQPEFFAAEAESTVDFEALATEGESPEGAGPEEESAPALDADVDAETEPEAAE